MDQHSEQRFTAWAAGKPLAVSELARLAVETIGPLREVMTCRQACEGPFAIEPAIDERTWLRFYRRKTLVQGFCDLLFGDPKIARRAYRIYLALQNPAAATPIELFSAFGIILATFVEHDVIEEQSCSFAEEIDAAIDEEYLETLMALPAMQFALRVAVPCWFVYGVLPDQLLWQVCGDDQKSAEKAVEHLVRFDHRVVHHPIIQHWIKADPKLASFRATKVHKWQRRRTPFDKPKKASTWLRVVFGMISSLSDLLDHRLKEPDLRELAEILQYEIPEDLMEYLREKVNDDLSREIRRKRELFQFPTKPDKSAFTFVREVLKESA